MASLPYWTNNQILDQLDSGYHLSGSSWTFAFPQNGAWIPNGTDEKAGFAGLNAAQQQAATVAIKLWDELIAPNMTQNTSGGPGTIDVANHTTTGEYAYAYYPQASGWQGSSVWLSSKAAELATPVVGQYGMLTLLHELGHTLGLDHMGNYNGVGNWATDASSQQDSYLYSVMSYFDVSQSGQANWTIGGVEYYPQTPMLNDVMAIQAIYGIDTTTRAGATTYGFNAAGLSAATAQIFDFTVNTHPILTIYDAGGVDTLDLSGFASNSHVNLGSGAYSSVAGMTNNIAIANTASIENAVGGAGNDTLVGNFRDNVLVGGAGIDQLFGGLGNDVLNGGLGVDVMSAGAGHDSYVVDAAGDVVTELFNAGIDTVYASVGYTLGAHVENVTLTGAVAINATGNMLANTLTGNAAANTLNGGIGADVMKGGGGDDTFVFDNVKDAAIETAGSGIDTVRTTVNVTLASHLENLTLLGTGNMIGSGNGEDNLIIGSDSSNDTLSGAAGNDRVFGGRGWDKLYGGVGTDWLDGGRGNDIMTGRGDSDVFHFDYHDVALNNDTITDFTVAGGGRDLLEISTLLTSSYDALVANHAFAQVGNNAVITLAGNQTVTLLNVDIDTLTVDHFSFV